MLECLIGVPEIGGIFDTHSHYDDPKFNGIRDELLTSLNLSGVEGIITCGCDIKSSKAAAALAKKHSFVYSAAGFHPENLQDKSLCNSVDLSEVLPILALKKTVAIGEIGLDYHWDIEKELQKKWFEAQLALSKELDMPVIIHDREAHGDTLELIKKYKPRGVVHCFSGSREMAEEVLRCGMYIGIGGVVTFKNARKTVEVAEMLPQDRILFETDCPYLSPEPFRGQMCHSGHIAFTAQKVAEIRGTSTKKILKSARDNVTALFGI